MPALNAVKSHEAGSKSTVSSDAHNDFYKHPCLRECAVATMKKEENKRVGSWLEFEGGLEDW
jgi:hypothetical protein